jgi:hypothetical protein
MDAFHFYCTNKRYYCHYDEHFQAWFNDKKKTATLQYFLGKQKESRSLLFPQCEFIVNFPPANPDPDTIIPEAYNVVFKINAVIEGHQKPRLTHSLDEIDLESESEDNFLIVRMNNVKDTTLMTITMSSDGIVGYKFSYDEIFKIQENGLKLHWDMEKKKYEVFDGKDHWFGYIQEYASIFADFSGCSQHKFPDNVQIEFPDCPFYKKQKY